MHTWYCAKGKPERPGQPPERAFIARLALAAYALLPDT